MARCYYCCMWHLIMEFLALFLGPHMPTHPSRPMRSHLRVILVLFGLVLLILAGAIVASILGK